MSLLSILAEANQAVGVDSVVGGGVGYLLKILIDRRLERLEDRLDGLERKAGRHGSELGRLRGQVGYLQGSKLASGASAAGGQPANPAAQSQHTPPNPDTARVKAVLQDLAS